MVGKKLETNQVSKTLDPLWHQITIALTIAALDMIASAGRPAPREYQHLDFVWGLSNNYFMRGKGQTNLLEVRIFMSFALITCYLKGVTSFRILIS